MALFSFGYKKKIEEVKQLVEAEDYEAAALAADDIPMQKVKSAYELNLIGKAYKCNGDFLQARNAFERSYELRCARAVLLDVMDCCLEIRDIEGAEKYFDEYHKVAPEDKVTQYMYRYRIEKKKGRERRLLIMILEELKALEYTEEFAYELAKQYHKAGMAQECMNECNEIILWFGFGPTVERAKTLLAYYRGEISLEEIKSAGVRYQSELTRQWQEEMLQTAQKPVQEEVQNESSEESYATEAAITEESEGTEEPIEEIEEEEPENPVEETLEDTVDEEDSEDEEDFVLPEIDITGLSFDEKTEESSRCDAELYAPEAEPMETFNEKLAELLKNKQDLVMDSLKNFGRIERIQKQIAKSLELSLSDREKTYFVITGEPQTGKTTLAFSMIRVLFELGIVKYDRTATIDAVQLNQVSIEDYGEELKNCNLIIENAGGMTKSSVDGLLRFSKNNKGKTCLILEDTVRDINKFLRAREELNRLFNNRIHLGKYNTDDLMGFAYDCIQKEDYCIDKMAAQVLKNKIDDIVRDYSNDQRLVQTLKLVETVMARAEKRTSDLLLSMATEGKIQQGNYLVIILEDVM